MSLSSSDFLETQELQRQLRGLDPNDPVAQAIVQRFAHRKAIRDMASRQKILADLQRDDASSDEETPTNGVAPMQSTKTGVIDGKKVTIIFSDETSNGVVDGLTNGQDISKTIQSIDAKDVGMTAGFKDLYSGKEDRRGNYTWQEQKPADLGKPAEDAETTKWALVVRNKRVYGDPRKVLAIHSIVVQSPLLRKLLKKVLKDYPGVTTSLRRLEFSGKFEPLIHRWAEFQDAVAALDDSEVANTTKEHAAILQGVLEKEFKSTIDESQDLMRNGVITYEYLWTIFQPGELVYTRNDGQDTALKLVNTQYGTDGKQNPCFWVTGRYVDWSGSTWGTAKLNMRIYPFAGTRKIGHLSTYPFRYHPEQQDLKTRLIERGSKVESYAGSHYKSYHGIAYNYDSWGNKDKHNIKDRIMIDTYGWNKFNPNRAVIVQPLSKDTVPLSNGINGHNEVIDEEDEADDDDYDPAEDDCGGGMPLDGLIEDENKATDLPPLTEEQKLICTPLLRGYALKAKEWLNFFVNAVQDITFNERAFDSLVLPTNQKELILGFTESQRANQGFDDVIEGKGKGIIILLCGPPGVGKTLTAESTSERMQAPLYMMSSGDLGLDPRHIENKLNMILEMCTRWNAILLLDEADVFLEERSLHELERNKLVSIFLRVLEYYEGIMFLTTNRVKTFDQAFQSRIHISLEYPELSIESRRTVWKNFLAWNKDQGQDNSISGKQLDKLATMNLNGRQIKNILKTARLLAKRREQILGHDHIRDVLDVTQHLHNATREDERTRSSIFC